MTWETRTVTSERSPGSIGDERRSIMPYRIATPRNTRGARAQASAEWAKIERPRLTYTDIVVKAAAKAVFSLEYLNNILKAAEIPSVVIISLKSDSPLKVEYSIGDGRVIYYLAPRIETA